MLGVPRRVCVPRRTGEGGARHQTMHCLQEEKDKKWLSKIIHVLFWQMLCVPTRVPERGEGGGRAQTVHCARADNPPKANWKLRIGIILIYALRAETRRRRIHRDCVKHSSTWRPRTYLNWLIGWCRKDALSAAPLRVLFADSGWPQLDSAPKEERPDALLQKQNLIKEKTTSEQQSAEWLKGSLPRWVVSTNFQE